MTATDGEGRPLLGSADTRISCTQRACSRRFVKALVLGQTVSLLICGTAVSTGLLQQQGVSIPTAQCFLNYVLLALVFGILLACRRQGRSLVQVLKQWWWRYFLLALLDVEANYLVVKAYQYTTVTSVQLLDCFSIFIVMLLSYKFLHAYYGWQHMGGAAVCLLGMLGLVLTDVLVSKNDNTASNVALGDILIIMGASMYGVSNVCQEYVVRTYDYVEYLAMIGLFGSFINGAQFCLLERDEVSTLEISYGTVLPLVAFVLSLFLLYSTMTVVIKMTSAMTVNLSILSADFYTLLFGLFLFNYKFHILYFLAFGTIIIGLAIYSLSPTAGSPEGNLSSANESVTKPSGHQSGINTSDTIPSGNQISTNKTDTISPENILESVSATIPQELGAAEDQTVGHIGQ